MPRGSEKRLHTRVSGQVTLRVSCSDLPRIEMETDNLSLGGVYCRSDRDLPPMTKLRLSIFLPSHDGRPARLHYPIEVDAVVVRSEPVTEPPAGASPGNGHAYRLALFFPSLATEAREALSGYLNPAPGT
jgi:hypothetical protein